MRALTTSFLSMWLKAAAELILFFPLFLVLHRELISLDIIIWFVLLIGFYSFGYMTSAWLQLNKWYSLLLVGLVLSSILVYGGLGFTLGAIITGLLCLYLFFRGTFMATRAWNSFFPTPFYLVGLVSYFLVSLYFHFKLETRGQFPILFWLGLVSVAITLLVTSQERIIQESLPERDGRHLVNNKQLWHSRFLSIGVLIIIVIAASLRQIAQALAWLNRTFWQNVLYLAKKLSQLFQSEPTEPLPVKAEQPELPPMDASEPSAFMVWLEKIMYVVIIVVLSAAALYLIYILAKQLIRYGKLLYNWLKGRLDQSEVKPGSGFVDESTSLTTWGSLIKSYNTKALEWLEQLRKREVKWSDLTTNAEKARYLYRLFVMKSLSKHNKIDSHLTAQETISSIQQRMPELTPSSEQLASLYNQARYSDHPIQDEDIKQLRKNLKAD